jgi:hypothetical protein
VTRRRRRRKRRPGLLDGYDHKAERGHLLTRRIKHGKFSIIKLVTYLGFSLTFRETCR